MGSNSCEHTLIVSLRIVPGRAHEHHALLNGLAYGLGDWSIFKDRFIEKSDVIHDDMRSGCREFLDSSNEIHTGGKTGAEEQVGPWRQVMDDFRQGPTLIAGVRSVLPS